jgi:hypothetical protein
MNNKDDSDFEVTYYRYCRDIHGNLVPIDMVRRGGRAVPRFPRDITDAYWLPQDSNSPDYAELLEEVCQCLNEIERRRWLLAISDGQSISVIAEMQGVSRQAIIDCFHRMAIKNPYVAIWLRYKNNRNQHE